MASATTERGGFRWRRTLRRVVMCGVMWGALVMAIGIGVVWAGGRWTRWRAGPFESPQRVKMLKGPDLPCCIGVWGQRGGFGVRHWSWNPQRSSGPGPFEALAFEPWMWKPSHEGMVGDQYWMIRIPYWIPTLLCVTTFASCFLVERRAKRISLSGKCVACGYDRTGLASKAPCPECGKGSNGKCAACGYDRAGLVSGVVCPECGAGPKALG